MGWTSGDGTRKQVTERVMQPWTSPRTGNTTSTLKHHAHGNEDWFLCSVVNGAGELVDTFIYLTVWEGGAHKDMEETCGPYYYGCPVEWFELVPCPNSSLARVWRDKVIGAAKPPR